MTDRIKTRTDGSIDTAYYIRRGRKARSQAAHDIARTVFPRRGSRSGTSRGWIVPLALLSCAALTLTYLA